MKQALENSCLKGCLIYAVALVVLLVLSAVGLGGISARFGGGGQGAKPAVVTGQTTSEARLIQASSPAANGNPQAAAGVQAGAQGDQAAIQPTVVPAAQTPTALVPPPVEAQQPIQAAPAPGGDSAPQVQVQGGVVSGQASVPFYIVQPGDTLWGIALDYGTKVDTLRAINKLGEDFIKPGQLLYLPEAGEQTQAPGPIPNVPPPVQLSTDTGSSAAGTPLPAMPDTGVNSRP